jgi:predicted ATP-dependent endonuclease of OLD family
MPSIKEIEISNYRAIDKILLKPKAINIFVGSNNSGKSSLLEAIAITLSLKNNFMDFEENNLYDIISFVSEYDPKFLVRKDESRGDCILKFDNLSIKASIEYLKSGYPDDERRNYIENVLHNKINSFFSSTDLFNRKFRDNYLSLFKESKSFIEDRSGKLSTSLDAFDDSHLDEVLTSGSSPTSFRYKSPSRRSDLYQVNGSLKKIDNSIEMSDYFQITLEKYIQNLKEKIEVLLYQSEKLIFSLYENDQLKIIFIIPFFKKPFGEERIFFTRSLFEGDERLIRIDCNPINVLNLPFITSFIALNSDEIEKLHDRVVKINKIHEAIDFLKKIEYIKDIRKTDEGLQIFISGSDTPIPLSSMGEGFKSLLTLTFDRFLLEDGILLLEEPEMTLHPRFIRIFAEEILSQSSNLQFFISTHSMDLISNILEIGERTNKLDDIQIIRTIKINKTNEINTEILEGSVAKNDLDDIEIDLRGT